MIQEEFAALTESVDTIAKGTKYNEFALLQQPHLDIGFLIDSSGSMDQEIIQVTNSISDFHSAFESAGFDVNFGLAECNLARDGVDALTLRNDINQTGFESALAGLTIQGGYVDPYSALLNASGANDFNNDNDSFSWRQYVSSTLILITDTNQEVHLTPGDPSQAEVAQMLADLGITVYVICDPGHIGAYNQITSLTGGTLYDKGDASGNLIPEALADIAEKSTGRSTMSITPIEVQVGIEGNEEDRLSIGLPVDATKIGLGLCGQDISTREGALEAMGVIDDAIDTVSQHRAQIGAANSRLDSILRDHETAIENETAGLSRIQDTDIAQGTGEFVRTQILAGSSTALLAQTLNMQKEFVRHLLESRNQFGLENRKNFLFNQNSYGMEILKTRKTSQGIGY